MSYLNLIVKTIYTLFIFLLPCVGQAQLQKVKTQLKFIKFEIPQDTLFGWRKEGKITININQSAYSNWQQEANNNVELSARLNHRFNYKTQKLFWDNYIIATFGLNKLQGQEIRKTQDHLEVNAIVGYQLPKNWLVSYFSNFQTQLTNTYDYENDAEKVHRINGFLSPLYLTTGPGFMWKKNDNLDFNLAPITGKFTFINGDIYRYNKDLQIFESDREVNMLGVEAGKKFNYQLGFYSSGHYQFKLTNNIKVDNRIALYANYLHDFSNMDVDYTLLINMEVNKYLNTQVHLQLRYDDDAIRRVQIREAVGVGIQIKI